MPKYKTANPRKKIPSPTLGKMLRRSEELGHEPWVRALMVLIWAYGIRRGELSNIRRGDLKIINEFLFLDSTPLKNPSKPDRELNLHVDTPYFGLLLDYLDTLGDDAYILPMSEKTFYRRLKAIDPELSYHVFRHWRGTRLPFMTDNPYEIMSWMGHSDIRTAIKYQHQSGVLAQKLGKKMRIQ